jgi:hypothetical protein
LFEKKIHKKEGRKEERKKRKEEKKGREKKIEEKKEKKGKKKHNFFPKNVRPSATTATAGELKEKRMKHFCFLKVNPL